MRHPSLFHLFTPVSRIKGVGSAVSEALLRLLPAATQRVGGGLPIMRDLLFHLPTGVVDRTISYPLYEVPDGAIGTFVVKVDEHLPPPMKRGSKKPYKVICSNDTGDIMLVFFHAHADYIKQSLPVGQMRVISGKCEHFDHRLQMPHPDIIAPVSQLAEVQKSEPIYPLTLGLTSRKIAKLVEEALAKLEELPEWQVSRESLVVSDKQENTIDYRLSTKDSSLSFKQALITLHHPQKMEDLALDSPARTRLAYDEILAHQLQLALLRAKMHAQAGVVIAPKNKLSSALQAALPYALTGGQKQVLSEIRADFQSGKRMARLLQGDVGSGKTIVALLAMLDAVEAGYQCALMAPTELIARQHAEVISKLLKFPLPLREGGRGWGDSKHLHGYSDITIERAKELRNQSTESEQKLWQYLRRSQVENYKFRRQQPIGNYIVDFYCPEASLIIELDGGQHSEQQAYDEKRTKFLEAQGYRVLRFWNHEVLENMEGIYDVIVKALHRCTPPPIPLPQGEGVSTILLTGSVKGTERASALEKIKSGEANIIIGTHALFQEHVEFKNLAFVVIDEQHRFGVNQRMALAAKGNQPHILHMTATPIPRSLTMMLYGDVDCSLLTEKPAQRKPIITRLIPRSRYAEVVERLKAALDRGEKAYWICPLVEETWQRDTWNVEHEKSHVATSPRTTFHDDLAAATARHKEFTARFGKRVGLVHGRMKAEERNAQMQKFTSGETNLLVATTVVEVGVDVRDATIMVIEQAERFGLSQLHQLRGRVGRGDKESACVLLYSDEVARDTWNVEREKSHVTTQPRDTLPRLSVLRETEDGFKIAEADLAIRGGGELLGVRQSGMPRMIFTDFSTHIPLIETARNDAASAVQADPMLASERGQALQILLQLFERELPAS